MGYQALLFCTDEKTARTVTQVLNELEFSVESSPEPFGAVKKLMSQHFDAIVVDCDNDQNATLLFKSARNSTVNQGSLAVAMVEGQAGVAKAFRIGANLVLTKPINVEQTKGTLRVARGLLRKGEPAKVPVATTPTSAAQSPLPATQVSSPKTLPQASMPSASLHADVSRQPAKPIANATANVSRKSNGAVSATNDEEDVIDINEAASAESFTPRATRPASRSEAPSVSSSPAATVDSAKDAPLSSPSSMRSGFGAVSASAAAPARSPQKSGVDEATVVGFAGNQPVFEKRADSGKIESSVSLPAPPLSFGGVNASAEQVTAGRKKIFIGVAAAMLVGIIVYVGWSQINGRHSSPVESVKQSAPASTSVVTPNTPESRSHSEPATELTPSAAPPSPQSLSQPTTKKSAEVPALEHTPHTSDKVMAQKSAGKPSVEHPAATAKSSSEAKTQAQPTETQPIVVKSGSVLTSHQSSAMSDAAAPTIDIAPSASGGSLPNLLSNPGESTKPVLQTLNVSQGVSQGLLIKKVQPIYPANAIRMHVEGSVRLMATISKTGDITAVKVLGGEPLLAQSAVDAVKQWKYKPYYLNGDPVEIQTQVTINFKLPR